MDDVLSDIFKRIQLESCVYFKKDFAAPWAMEMDVSGMAQFHLVTRGHCVLQDRHRQYHGAAGDIFLLPRGGWHYLGDRPNQKAVPGSDLMASLQTDQPLFSDGDVEAQLICGHYDYREDLLHPLITQLPAIIHLKSRELPELDALNSFISLLMAEMSEYAPGGTAVIEKLAEVLLVKILRSFLLTTKQPTGFLSALKDPRLSKAVDAIHKNHGEDLSLEDLANAAGMSRSSFAAHFKDMTGLTPAVYLTHWRMFLACEMLRAGDKSSGQIADQIGYESEVSFSRAFRRYLNVTPAVYRRQA